VVHSTCFLHPFLTSLILPHNFYGHCGYGLRNLLNTAPCGVKTLGFVTTSPVRVAVIWRSRSSERPGGASEIFMGVMDSDPAVEAGENLGVGLHERRLFQQKEVH
jgi:hypothetical protein